MKKALASAVVLLLARQVSGAQAPVEAGERVRARLANGGVITGTLLRAGSDSLQIATAPQLERELPLEAIARLDRSLGVKRQTGLGAAWGAAVGGTFALLFLSDAELAGEVALRTVPLGAVLGAAIGSAVQAEVWRPVDLNRLRDNNLKLSLGLRPTREGVASGVSVSWR